MTIRLSAVAVFEIRQHPSHRASSNIDTLTAGPSNSRKQQNTGRLRTMIIKRDRIYCEEPRLLKSLEIDIETHSENPKIEKDEGHIFKKWLKLFFECGRKTGRTWEIVRGGRQEEYMREAGFTDLFSKSWKLPVGGWPQDKKLKQIGLYNGAFIDHSIDAFAIFPIGEILGWSKEEVTVLVSQMRKALKEPRALPYFNVRMVYGRKPESSPKTA
ncbi:mRNA 3 end-processing YTH1 [Fusarium napiforme]|uniref:mRNA 3 end-processing YTH1 n=1 Tax=Fusarium napiforme TaxID=42672 RepID=A0A8H5JTM3_9HYPO|nr:mRNA 3 end-processing YTH1 [Fusarium napiforme]